MSRIDGEIFIEAPVEEVFDLVADERNEPTYNPRIAYAEKTSRGPLGVGSRFLVQPRGMGGRGAMTMEVREYDRPQRFATSIRSSYLDSDGGLTFTSEDGGTSLHWHWDMRLHGPMRVMSPLLRVIAPRWERRNWVGLKEYVEHRET